MGFRIVRVSEQFSCTPKSAEEKSVTFPERFVRFSR
jgi:hypothetical protein